MTVYVHPPLTYEESQIKPRARMFGTRWSHMIADSHDELVQMARRLRLQPSWIQNPGTWSEHFDLTPTKYHLALALGAVEITLGEMGEKWAAKRGQRQLEGV